jgi:hypothetical protein
MQQTIGRYKIIGELGRSALGTVYRALDTSIDREAAIKVPHLDQSGDALQDSRERFLREARAAARLNHPNIVTIYDVGQENGIAYVAMELLAGRSLRQILRDSPQMSMHAAARIAEQIAQALDHAQRAQVVHRGLRPGNVMISPEGGVKLTDFGVACSPSPARTLTGDQLASLRYMSPEQALGLAVDLRSDIFSLGVTLYEMLVKRTPFERAGEQTPLALMARIAREAHRPVCETDALIPPEMDHILARALAKNPGERYARAGEMAEELRNLTTSIHGGMRVSGGGAARDVQPPAPPLASTPGAGVDLKGLVGDLDAFAKNFESDRHARMRQAEAEPEGKKEAPPQPGDLPQIDFERFLNSTEDEGARGSGQEPGSGEAPRGFRRHAAHYFNGSAPREATQTNLLDHRLRAALRYFADLAVEVKSLKPVLPHPYEIAHFGEVTGLCVSQATVENRLRKIDAQEVVDQVVLRYEMQAPQAVTVDLSPYDLPEFRRKLDAAQFRYTVEEKKNGIGKLMLATAALASVNCWVTLRGEYNDGTIDIELKNVRRLGVARTRLMVDGFAAGSLDNLAHYVFGFNDAFASLLKSAWA